MTDIRPRPGTQAKPAVGPGDSDPATALEGYRFQLPAYTTTVGPMGSMGFVSHIVGMGEAESIDLIEELCRHTDSPEYQCRFQWRTDSMALWDNRAVQHYASSDYYPDVRFMERASIIGDRPR